MGRFKRVVFVYYTAVLVVGANVASNSQNAVCRERDVAQGFRLHLPSRQIQPFTNETMSRKISQVASEIMFTPTVIVSTADETPVMPTSGSDHIPSPVTTQAPSSSYGLRIHLSETRLGWQTSPIASNDVLPSAATKTMWDGDLHSSTQRQYSSARPSVNSTALLQDETSYQSAPTILSVTRSGFKSATNTQDLTETVSEVTTHDEFLTLYRTPTPISDPGNSRQIPNSQLPERVSTVVWQPAPLSLGPDESKTGAAQTGVSAQPTLLDTPAGVTELPLALPVTSKNNSTRGTFAVATNVSPVTDGLASLSSPSSGIAPASVTSSTGRQDTVSLALIPVTILAPTGITFSGLFDTDNLPRPSTSSATSLTRNNIQLDTAAPSASSPDTAFFPTTPAANPTLCVSGRSTAEPPLPSSITIAAGNQTTARTLSALVTVQATTEAKILPYSSDVLVPQATGISYTNSTSSFASHSLSAATTSLLHLSKASILSTAKLGITFSGSAVPTGIINKLNLTLIESLHITPTPDLYSSTLAHTTLVTVTSVRNPTSQAHISVSTVTHLSDTATFLVDPNHDASKTLASTFVSTSSATQTAVAPAPPLLPPLTTAQTAGVVVGSTAGVLLAVVAAIFMVRRCHSNRTEVRTSTKSNLYPRVAYLYDPPINSGGGEDGGDGDASAFVSGGAGGMPPGDGHTLRAPQTPPAYSQRPDIETMRYSNPRNPFRDPEDPFLNWNSPSRECVDAQINVVSALSPTTAGYAAASYKSPAIPGNALLQPNQRLCDHIIPSPTLIPFIADHSFCGSHARSEIRNSVNSRQPHIVHRTSTVPSSATMEYPPLSPYERQPNHSLVSVTQPSTTDPFAEPFEPDLLLPVDTLTETSDSVTVYASPTPVQQTVSTKVPERNFSVKSPLSPAAAYFLLSPHSQYTNRTRTSLSSLPQPERCSLAHDRKTYVELATNSQAPTQTTHSGSPVLPPSPPPRNKGWDEIMRYSNGSRIASLVSPRSLSGFNPLPPIYSPPSKKKRSLIQLRREGPALAGIGQIRKSTTGHPSAVKTPFTYSQDAGFEAPRMSLLMRMNSLGGIRGDGNLGLGITGSGSVCFDDLLAQKEKRRRVGGSDSDGIKF